tara:strand:+ start:2380 stop:3063 length:684 start_codon:yes stop_codon:yes gene_type:complete
LTRTLLLTRPLADSQAFAARLPQGWRAHIAPMQDMRDLPASPDFAQADALVFTSQNGVRSFASRWALRDLPAFCVGPATADMAESLGLRAIAAQGDLPSLAALLALQPAQNLLYLHGRHVSGDLAQALAGSGHVLQSHAIYDQQARGLDAATQRALTAGKIHAVALFSPRSARLLAESLPDGALLHCFCLSQNVADAAQGLGTSSVAAEPSAAALLAIIGASAGRFR